MVIQKYLTETNFTRAIARQKKCIVIHYTANNGDTAWGNCNYFYIVNRGASAHYFVDETSIWQSVEDKNIAWSIGLDPEKIKAGKVKYHNYARNKNSINIEMCSKKDKDGNYYIPEATVKNTIELTKYLMKKYNIKDVFRHYDCTLKRCPEPWVRDPAQWINFKKALEVEDEERRDNI